MKLSKMIFAALIAATALSCTEQPKEQTVMEDKNEVIENIMARRSIRKYQDRPVSRDTLNKIMECGINAPNGQNKQSWEVRIVDNADFMKEIDEAMAKSHPDVEFAKGCMRGATLVHCNRLQPHFRDIGRNRTGCNPCLLQSGIQPSTGRFALPTVSLHSPGLTFLFHKIAFFAFINVIIGKNMEKVKYKFC